MLLGVLSLGAVLVYRSAPQSVAEVRTEGLLAARPNAYGPNMARARERLETARREATARGDSVAAELDSVAADHAWRAGEIASSPEERDAALRLWAEAMLERAQRLHRLGTGSGLRRDDNELLNRSLQLVQRVLSTAPPAEIQLRADSLRREVERQLRPGPLEWLPRSR